jgi:hypothetical protein
MDLLGPDRLTIAEAALVICGIWSLWSGRNEENTARRNGTRGPRAAVRHVSKMLEDTVCSIATQEASLLRPRKRWRRPQEDWQNVNTNASLCGVKRLVLVVQC